MTIPSDPRLAAILHALDTLPPEALDAAARVTPGAPGRVLGELARAVRAPDRAERVRAIVEKDLSNLEALGRLFGAPPGAAPAGSGPVGAALRGALARVDVELGRACTLADALTQVRAGLSESVESALEAVADDPELTALAREAADELRDDEALKVASDVVRGASALRDQLQASLSVTPGPGVAPDLAALQDAATRLEADAGRAEALANGVRDRVLPSITRLAELARTRRHAAAPALSAAEAALAERLAGPADPAVRRAWRRALDLAIGAGNLGVAWTAGKHVQIEALDIGDPKLAAVVAHRVADLARAQGDLSREVVARMEEALLLLRIPGYADQGRSMAEDMLARVEEAPAGVRARVLLMAGQLYEQLGDEARARTLFRRVMRAGKSDASFAPELGRAALHLGRLEQRAGQPAQSRKDLRLAYEIAGSLGDARLYVEAVPALVEALAEAGKDEDAGTVVREAAGRLASLGQAAAFRAELERRWGAARVARWWP